MSHQLSENSKIYQAALDTALEELGEAVEVHKLIMVRRELTKARIAVLEKAIPAIKTLIEEVTT